MASVKESSMDHASSVGFDDDDIRGDGKKKKFKPLSAMRKFFGKRRKKEDSVVTVKAQSTTALHSSGYDEDEEEDDGGFKSHQKPKSLAGNRSISEDSIFSPEQRETISPFPKSAVSEESLPKSAFQSELLSKLNKRRSQYSDDDHDDGLPRSPVPPVTTADVIMGSPLKPGTSGKKSSNRDSDQSLISVDGSENEEEDLFLSKWKSSVVSKKTADLSSPKTSSSSMDLDFNSVQKTELLANSAARDKIAVKPKRAAKASRKSGKKRDTSSPQSLPSLNEESPTRSPPEEVKSWTSGSPVAKSSEVVQSKSEDKQPISTATTSSSRSPLSAVDNKNAQKTSGASARPNLSSITITSKSDKAISSSKPALSTSGAATSATAAPVASSPPPKATTPTSPSAKFEPPSKSSGVHHSSASATQNLSPSSPSGSAGLSTASASLSSKETKASETVSVIEKVSDKTPSTSANEDVAVLRHGQKQKEGDDEKPSIDVKSRMSRFQPPSSGSSSSSKFGTSSVSATPDTPALKVTEPGSNVTLSPKEDYKARRQVRSRTLPGMTESDEQSSPKVQRSSSHRIQISTDSTEASQPAGPPEPEKNTTASSGPMTSSTTSGSNVKKLSNLRFGPVDSTPSEPAWKSNLRKKQEEQQGTNVESDSSKGPASVSEKMTTEVAPLKSVGNTSTAKSVFSSASYLEKKRGSVETVSFKGRDASDQSSKKTDTSIPETKPSGTDASPTKRPSVDMSPTKRPSIDISSTRRESIEIDISELSSVKALRSSFAQGNKTDSSAKSGSLKDNKPSVPSATTTTSDNVKPSAAASSISPFRGGSVKTAPTTSVETKSGFSVRGGSIKGSAFNSPSAAAKTSSSTSSTVLNKTESGSAANAGSSASSSAPTTSVPTQSSTHASQPNTSLPSHTAAVTSPSSSTSNTKPFSNAFSSRPYTGSASSAFRPASTFNQPSSKTSAASTNPATTAASTTTPTPTPTPAGNFGVKSASNSLGAKTFPVSNVKPLASNSSVASNVISTPASTSSNVVSTSTVTSSSLPSSNTSPSRSSSVRSHSSFTTSSAFKPQISSTSPNFSSRTSSVTKSPSFKSTTTTTPTAKTSAEEKTSDTTTKVPAWRANLGKKDTNLTKEVKIEIIENSPSQSSSSSSSSQNKSENLSKDKNKVAETAKKSDSSSSCAANVQADKASNRSSKVLDMVKNFQNLQVS